MRYALILAGGSGTRLWPLSRAGMPKQLVPLADGRSLLEVAYERLEGLVPERRRFVCGSARHSEATLSRIAALAAPAPSGLPRLIAEPEGRDTMAAIAVSCALIAQEDPEAVVAVFTSDHVIRPEGDFRGIVDAAFSFVEERPEAIVTFGVRPAYAAAGFGYLELGEPVDRPSGAGAAAPREVLRFREKPDPGTAAAFLEAGPGRFLWNSGMFLWKASRFLELLARFEPATAALVAKLVEAAGESRLEAAMAEIYPRLRKISVDYGIMEPASKDSGTLVVAFPLDVEWLDIGSWPAYAQLLESDENGNTTMGETALSECSGTLAYSAVDGHLVACLGCSDLVVVHTKDATLVCPKSRADELKILYGVVSGAEDGKYR